MMIRLAEWIPIVSLDKNKKHNCICYKCSACSHIQIVATTFCSKCEASMKDE